MPHDNYCFRCCWLYYCCYHCYCCYGYCYRHYHFMVIVVFIATVIFNVTVTITNAVTVHITLTANRIRGLRLLHSYLVLFNVITPSLSCSHQTILQILMQNIQVLHLWQLDLTILTAQISRSSVERTCVCGCQSAFTAFIASDSNSKHTRKTLTDFGLTGTSLRHSNRHLKTLWDGKKRLHAIVRSRTVTWLTRWRLPQ